MLYLAVALLFISSVAGQVTRNGTCNFSNILAYRDLNLTQLSGDWYQIRRIPNTFEHGTCSTINIISQFSEDGIPKVTIQHREVSNGNLEYRNGTIDLQDRNYGPLGQFMITYEDVVYDSIMLATNFKSYGLMYSCMNINENTKNVWAWVLSRDATLNEKDEDIIKNFVDSYEDFKNVRWTTVEHTEEACRVNSSNDYRLSYPLAIFAFIFAGNGIAL